MELEEQAAHPDLSVMPGEKEEVLLMYSQSVKESDEKSDGRVVFTDLGPGRGSDSNGSTPAFR